MLHAILLGIDRAIAAHANPDGARGITELLAGARDVERRESKRDGAARRVRFLRIHIHRLAKRLIVIDPYSLADVVAMMTGAMAPSA